MEFFKTNVMRQEYKSFIEEILLAAASYIENLQVTCNRCKDQRCSNCCAFKSSIEILTKSGDEIVIDFLMNFIKDFFNSI